MPQKKNPAVAVLKYFSEASLEQATLTMDLAKEVLRSRRAKPAPAPKKTTQPRTNLQGPVAKSDE